MYMEPHRVSLPIVIQALSPVGRVCNQSRWWALGPESARTGLNLVPQLPQGTHLAPSCGTEHLECPWPVWVGLDTDGSHSHGTRARVSMLCREHGRETHVSGNTGVSLQALLSDSG